MMSLYSVIASTLCLNSILETELQHITVMLILMTIRIVIRIKLAQTVVREAGDVVTQAV